MKTEKERKMERPRERGMNLRKAEKDRESGRET